MRKNATIMALLVLVICFGYQALFKPTNFAINYMCRPMEVAGIYRPYLEVDKDGKVIKDNYAIRCMAANGKDKVIQPNYGEPVCWKPEAISMEDLIKNSPNMHYDKASNTLTINGNYYSEPKK